MEIAQRRHPLYEEHIDLWEFYLESFKGGQEYIKKNLTTHRLENLEDYNNRMKRAYYLNYCSPICNIPADFIFKKEATRPADVNLVLFREDVDRRGNNIHEFMRKICILSNIYGHVHILMDSPKLDENLEQRAKEGKITKSDAAEVHPYLVIIHPQALVDWSVNSETGALEWILIKEELFEDSDPENEREIKSTYKLWTREYWKIYDENGTEIEGSNHNLGFVPLITNYHKDIDLDMIGEGMLKDVARANKVILNWSSEIDEMVARQTFSQLICPDDGDTFIDEVDDSGSSKALKKIGVSSIFTFPSNASHPPKFISPDTSQIEVIWNMIDKHVKEMFRMSGLISAKTSLVQLQQRTGKAQEFEFLDMAVFFAAKAKKLEDTENKINRMFYQWQQINDLPDLVHYPDKFDISTPSEIVDLFAKVLKNNISPRLNKEMAKRLVHQVLPHAEDSIIEMINDEIEDNSYLENPFELTENNKDTIVGQTKETKPINQQSEKPTNLKNRRDKTKNKNVKEDTEVKKEILK